MGRADRSLLSKTEWRTLADELAIPDRQAAVVYCLFSGMSDKEIAIKTNVTVHTVRTHLTRFFVKMNVQDRNELIVRVFDRFLADCRQAGCSRCRTEPSRHMA